MAKKMKKSIGFIVIATLSVLVSIAVGLSIDETEWRKKNDRLNSEPQSVIKLLNDNAKATEADKKNHDSREKTSMDSKNITTIKNFLKFSSRNSTNKTNTTEENVPSSKLHLKERQADDVHSMYSEKQNSPLNVVLVLVDGLEDGDTIRQLKLETISLFPLQGFFKCCPEVSTNFDFLAKNSNCDCDDRLRSNILSFLSWARHIKKKVIGSLFTMHGIDSNKSDEDDEDDKDSDAPRKEREAPRDSHVPINSNLASMFESEGKKDKKKLLSLQGILKQMKESLLRVFIDAIDNNSPSKQDSLDEFRYLLNWKLDNINNIPHENGYILIIMASIDELNDTLELIHNYAKSQNTLTIITSNCPRDKSSAIPIFGRGPGIKRVVRNKVPVLYELPKILRGIIKSRECRALENKCDQLTSDTEEALDYPIEPSDHPFEWPPIQDDRLHEPGKRLARNIRQQDANSDSADSIGAEDIEIDTMMTLMKANQDEALNNNEQLDFENSTDIKYNLLNMALQHDSIVPMSNKNSSYKFSPTSSSLILLEIITTVMMNYILKF